jgi:hypothetical protein
VADQELGLVGHGALERLAPVDVEVTDHRTQDFETMVIGIAGRAARRREVRYSLLFMRADGAQLEQITALIDKGVLRPAPITFRAPLP